MSDLTSAVAACLEAATFNVREYDQASLAEEAHEHVSGEADSACIYYSTCLDIISRYEREYGSDADDIGTTYKPSEWQEAAQAYAYGVASAAIYAMLEEELEDIEEKAEALREASENEDLSMDRSCPFGWMAHASETPEGVCYWPNVEGSGPRWAIDCGAFWLWAGKAEPEEG